MITKSIHLIAFMLFLISNSFSQTVLETNIDNYIQANLQENNIPGLAIAIVVKDSVIISKGYGVRQYNKSEPVDDKSLFQIASLTKPFTATLIGMLKEQGVVAWDDKIIEHLPDFTLSDSCVTSMITISDILSIRAGIQGTDNILSSSRKEYMTLLKNYPTSSGFRTEQSSFNTHYTIAGYLSERIEDQSWESLVRKKILNPLGMISTFTSIETAIKATDNIALPHSQRSGEITPIDLTDVSIFSPAGGLISNVSDLSKFISLFLNYGTFGSQTYLSKSTIQQMFSPNMIVGDSFRALFNPYTKQMTFGYGWFLSYYEDYYVAEMEGSLPGTSSLIALIPDKEIGLVLLTNKHFCFNSLVEIKFHILDLLLEIDN